MIIVEAQATEREVQEARRLWANTETARCAWFAPSNTKEWQLVQAAIREWEDFMAALCARYNINTARVWQFERFGGYFTYED